MKSWNLTQKTENDPGNDVELQLGQVKTVSDMDALRCRIDAALQIIKGELQDPTIGVDYFGIVMSDTPIPIKVQELCRVINSLEGVKSTTYESAILNKETGVLTFKFTIHSVFGDMEYEKEI